MTVAGFRMLLWPGFITWMLGLTLIGLVAAGLIVVTWLVPDWLSGAAS